MEADGQGLDRQTGLLLLGLGHEATKRLLILQADHARGLAAMMEGCSAAPCWLAGRQLGVRLLFRFSLTLHFICEPSTARRSFSVSDSPYADLAAICRSITLRELYGSVYI